MINLTELTDTGKVPLLLEWLDGAAQKLNRAWPAGGSRYLEFVREMRGEPLDPE
ncbi:hypothetical protein [Delftia acidovorans]